MNETLRKAIKNTYRTELLTLIPKRVRDKFTAKELEDYGEILATLFERFLAGLEITIPEQEIGPGSFTAQAGGRSYSLSGSTSLAAHNATITYKENNND